MEKKAVLLLLCLTALAMLAPFNAFSQDTIRIKLDSNPLYGFSTDLSDDSIQDSPAPLEGLPDSLLDLVSWRYFWMIDNGLFGWDSTVTVRFTENRSSEVATKLRGRYSGTGEPPAMRTTVNPGGITSPTAYPSPLDTILDAQLSQQLGIFPNWTAMRIRDTLYLALSVRNYFDLARSGYLKLLFPSAEFRYVREVFSSERSVHFGNISQEEVYDGNGVLTGNLCTWRIDTLPSNKTQTLFLEIVSTDAAQDNTTHLFKSDVIWDNEIPPTGSSTPASIFKIGKDQTSGTQTLNPILFNPEASTHVNINRARDPNALTVSPVALPPSPSAPAHKLLYRVDVENIGSVLVSDVKVTVHLDRAIDPQTRPMQILEFNFPNAAASFNPNNIIHDQVQSNVIIFDLKGVNLNGSKYGSSESCKGHFYFEVKTKANIPLANGQQLVSWANVVFRHNNVTEDSVDTAPAIVHIQEPKGNPYGCLLGVKYFNNLSNPDSIKNNGLALTFMAPLYRPRGNTLQSKYLKAPALFWQFELGIGAATFNGPGDSSRVQTNYVHLSPAQLRYTGGVLPGGITKFGLSAGYSVNYVYKAEENNQKVAFQSGLGRRLEHELFATADFFNLSGVPGITIGAGYKYRWNKIFADRISYHCPFVYAQLNFALLRKNSIQLWDKVYRW